MEQMPGEYRVSFLYGWADLAYFLPLVEERTWNVENNLEFGIWQLHQILRDVPFWKGMVSPTTTTSASS
jgi:hypothetical protein